MPRSGGSAFRWTDAEIGLLKAWRSRLNTAALIKKLGWTGERSVQAVDTKASRLGLPRNKTFPHKKARTDAV